MKKTILLTILISTIFTFFIYKKFSNDTLTIVSFGDGLSLGVTAYDVQGYSFNDYLRDDLEEKHKLKKFIPDFSNMNETTETLKMKLNNNYTREGDNLSINQAIGMADMITISIGMYELNLPRNLTGKEINTYLENVQKILSGIRFYTQKKIYFLSLYETTKLSSQKVTEINKELKQICENNKVTLIDIEEIANKKEFFFNNTNFYLNYKGHKFISELIKRENETSNT